MNKKAINKRSEREKALRKMIGVDDFSQNGKCSKCGRCCGHLLPLSFEDRWNILKYVITNNIQPYEKDLDKRLQGNEATCPYRNEDKCLIYEVRPFICKNFYCYNLTEMLKAKKVIAEQNFPVVDMWDFARMVQNIKTTMLSKEE